MPIRLNAEQRLAVDQRGSSISLSAGAGSGKTEVLVRRYLSYLELDGASVPEILAITFTEKAAKEMQQRLHDTLSRKIQDENLNEDPKWQNHLSDLEQAKVQTIHAFCQSVLFENPEESEISLDSTILTPAQKNSLLQQSIRRRLQQIILEDDHPLHHSLAKLSELYGWYAVIDSFASLLESIKLTEWTQFLDRDYLTQEKLIQTVLHEYLPILKRYLVSTTPGLTELLQWVKHPGEADREIRFRIYKIYNRFLQFFNEKLIEEDIIHFIEKQARTNTVKEGLGYSSAPEEATSFLKLMRDIAKSKLKPLCKLQQSFEKAFHLAAECTHIAIDLADYYQQIKREQKKLDFDDLIAFCLKLFQSNQEVLAHYQRTLRFIMVDEFQDTDPMQIQLIQHLIQNQQELNRLFIVGDPKQSIYQFRGADSQLFSHFRESLPKSGQLSINQNFRSDPQIISFVNDVFETVLPAYERLIPSRTDTLQLPTIECWWTPRDDDYDDFENPDFSPDARQRRIQEAKNIAEQIHKILHDSQQFVIDKTTNLPRRVQQRDIVLLFRGLNQVNLYERALEAYQLDYYVVGGAGFYLQQEIYDILNVLKVIDHPGDDLAIFGFLRSPFVGLSDTAIYLLSQSDGGLSACLDPSQDFPDTLDSNEKNLLQFAQQRFLSWRDLSDQLSIADLLRRVIEDSAFDAALQLEILGDRKLSNLWKLIELAEELSSDDYTLSDYILYLEEAVLRNPREEQATTKLEEDDVIRLMTIHQSKGLEFPIVVLADINAKKLAPRLKNFEWDTKLGMCVKSLPLLDPEAFNDVPSTMLSIQRELSEWQENLRLFYVACTRARDRLILSGSVIIKENLPIWLSPYCLILQQQINLWQVGIQRIESESNYQIHIQILAEVAPQPKSWSSSKKSEDAYIATPQWPAETPIAPRIYPLLFPFWVRQVRWNRSELMTLFKTLLDASNMPFQISDLQELQTNRDFYFNHIKDDSQRIQIHGRFPHLGTYLDGQNCLILSLEHLADWDRLPEYLGLAFAFGQIFNCQDAKVVLLDQPSSGKIVSLRTLLKWAEPLGKVLNSLDPRDPSRILDKVAN